MKKWFCDGCNKEHHMTTTRYVIRTEQGESKHYCARQFDKVLENKKNNENDEDVENGKKVTKKYKEIRGLNK